VFDGLREVGIRAQVHYVPLHRQPVYASLGFRADDLPQTEQAYQELISLPMYPGLTNEQQATVINVLEGLVT
jgi:dTDP-4-amino-4,6-dideoxygalactose transaminase